MKHFFGYYEISNSNPNHEAAKKILEEIKEWCEKNIGGRWFLTGTNSVFSSGKEDWLTVVGDCLRFARKYDTQIYVRFRQRTVEDSDGDWYAFIGYDDGRNYCNVSEAYRPDVVWPATEDILAYIEDEEDEENA